MSFAPRFIRREVRDDLTLLPERSTRPKSAHLYPDNISSRLLIQTLRDLTIRFAHLLEMFRVTSSHIRLAPSAGVSARGGRSGRSFIEVFLPSFLQLTLTLHQADNPLLFWRERIIAKLAKGSFHLCGVGA